MKIKEVKLYQVTDSDYRREYAEIARYFSTEKDARIYAKELVSKHGYNFTEQDRQSYVYEVWVTLPQTLYGLAAFLNNNEPSEYPGKPLYGYYMRDKKVTSARMKS